MTEFSEIKLPPDLIQPRVELVGQDGNAFAILGRTRLALRRAGNSRAVIDDYTTQATSGDYDHLLVVTMAFCEVS